MTASRFGVLLLVLPALVSPASGQSLRGLPGVVAPSLQNGPARTGCLGGQPVTVYTGAIDPEIRAELEVHEAVHRRQLAGDCDAALAWILSDRARHADVEAEAGCAQLEAAVRWPARPDTAAGARGWLRPRPTMEFALGRLRDWLYERFPELPHRTLDLLIARRCGLWKGA